MVKGEEWFMIKDMYRQGLSIAEISRRTGRDRKTVRKVIRSTGPPLGRKGWSRPSKLDPFKGYLVTRMSQGVFNAEKLMGEIKRMGYEGRISILREFIHPFRESHREVATQRFETPPGKQAQVDWAHFGVIDHHGQRRKLSCFVMTLGYSRAMYCEFTVSQDLETFERCHIHAFRYFGGVPDEILYDRVKTVVFYQHPDGSIHWNPAFGDFAHYYGFTPRLCPPYRAQTKGKVEASIKYIRGNFFQGLFLTSLADLNQMALEWLNETANSRVHGTTKEVPFHRLAEEKLTPVDPRPDYDTSYISWRQVTKDSFISYKGNRYSVPSRHNLRRVLVKETPQGMLELYVGRLKVASHRIEYRRGMVVALPEHLPSHPMPKRKFRLEPRWQNLFPEVETRSLQIYEEVALRG
jgi:transposase